MTSDRPKLIQLSRTEEWVHRSQAKAVAFNVYSQFSMNPARVEPLARLALVAHHRYTSDSIHSHLDPTTINTLIKWQYLTPSANVSNLAASRTLYTQLAENMIVPEVQDGDYGGFLVEPFAHPEIMDELYAMYKRTLAERRRNSNAD